MSLLSLFCSSDSRTLPATHSPGANPHFQLSKNHLLSSRSSMLTSMLPPTLCSRDYLLLFEIPVCVDFIFSLSHFPLYFNPQLPLLSRCPPVFPISPLLTTSSLQPTLSPLSLGSPGLPSSFVCSALVQLIHLFRQDPYKLPARPPVSFCFFHSLCPTGLSRMHRVAGEPGRIRTVRIQGIRMAPASLP